MGASAGCCCGSGERSDGVLVGGRVEPHKMNDCCDGRADDGEVRVPASVRTADGEFRILLRKTAKQSTLGVDVDMSSGTKMLVTGLVPGMIQDWNNGRKNDQVCIGDEIVEVNGIRGDCNRMTDRVVDDKELQITIRPRRGVTDANQHRV
mmetsp:Transcript_48283/g.125885  ORF Transcript_48283/g.125885 Transcript_48283/m.125885 type:complete len:150 (-) Transcript_48283:25-474(-)